MNANIASAAVGGILTFVIMSAMGSFSNAPSDCGTRLLTSQEHTEYLLMQREVESLKKLVLSEREKCNLASSIEKNVSEQQARAAREEERQRKEAEAEIAQRRDFIRRARSGQLIMSEWIVSMQGKSKTEVTELLGKPSGVVRPTSSEEYALEMWSYKNFVKLEESQRRRHLILNFYRDRVETVSSADP